jgi:hypothetical protein
VPSPDKVIAFIDNCTFCSNTMKANEDGPVSQTGETTTTTAPSSPRPSLEEIIDADDLAYRARLKAMGEKRTAARKKITIEISADAYGYLCAAGVVHDGTPEEVAAALLDEHVTDWANDDFYLDDVEI